MTDKEWLIAGVVVVAAELFAIGRVLERLDANVKLLRAEIRNAFYPRNSDGDQDSFLSRMSAELALLRLSAEVIQSQTKPDD